jgi:hypothetical protein
MPPERIVAFVGEALDGGLLDGAVHPLDLAAGSGVTRYRQPMLDVEIGACRFEGMAEQRFFLDRQRR